MNFLFSILRPLSRIAGAIVKGLGYPFHWVFPNKRFHIPLVSPAVSSSKVETKIPKIIWQTNYTDKVTLPVYINFLFNRLMSGDYEHRHHCDAERLDYIQKFGTEEQIKAFNLLNDGAAQADFWRLFVLYHEGGAYLDIDGQFLLPLSKIIRPEDDEVFVHRNEKGYTNYFIASKPKNPMILALLNQVVKNIEDRFIENGVYQLTGPGVFTQIVKKGEVNDRLAKNTCLQGTFTNEHFQYMDKKRSKWTYKKPEDLLKEE